MHRHGAHNHRRNEFCSQDGHEGHACHHSCSPVGGWFNEKLQRVILASVLLAGAVVVESFAGLPLWQVLLVYLVPYLVAGWDTLIEAVGRLAKGKALDEAFLMTIATVGALAIGFFPDAESQFSEAVLVMLLYQAGEYFEGLAEGRSRWSIESLLNIRPDTAIVERVLVPAGEVTELTLPAEEVGVGEIVVVRPGDRLPLDGVVVDGQSILDTAALTGESVPKGVMEGDSVLSGCINLSGLLRVRVTKSFGESTASRILRLVEEAANKKSACEGFITRFARVYTPIVVVCAAILAVIPPIFLGSFPDWLYRACVFLVVSCPCALVISVPLTFFAGIGAASRKGILVKGSAHIETLSRVDTMVMDKTGTLTEGVFEVTAVHPEVIDERELLHLAAHVERHSTHPIAQSLRAAHPDDNDGCLVEELQEIAGRGVGAKVNGRTVWVGSTRLMDSVGAVWHPCDHSGTIVHVAMDGLYVGHIVISDRLREGARDAVTALRACGVRRIVVLTGDVEPVSETVAGDTGVDEWYSGLLPEGKVETVERLLGDVPKGKSLAFVGDGINDAPVLTRADVGIAMGGLGSDAAIEAADVVLMDDKLSKLALSINLARRTVHIARQNILGAIGVKLAVLLLAAAGMASLWMAIFADVGVCLLTILNAMRAMNTGKFSNLRGF